MDESEMTTSEGRATSSDLQSQVEAMSVRARLGRQAGALAHLPLEVGNAVGLLRPELKVTRVPLAVTSLDASRPTVGRRRNDAALEKADRHLATLLPLGPPGVVACEEMIALLALGLVGPGWAGSGLAPRKGRQAGSARCRRTADGRAPKRLPFGARSDEGVDGGRRLRRARRHCHRRLRDGQQRLRGHRRALR